MIRLHNTLSKKTEEFTPIEPNKVKMYHCGPTVYDYIHIGNLRAFLLADLLRRMFEANNYEVLQVMNITDVGHLVTDGDAGDDKMTKALHREGKTVTLEHMLELAEFYRERFVEDLHALNIKIPHIMPKASDHIAEDLDIIKKLEDQGFTYTTSDGVYFDTEKMPDYGKLGGLPDISHMEARVTDNAEKKNPRDFALWKFNADMGWESPWGKGFPGWHIECSGMSQRYLGDTFDIHTGGIDLSSVHHNNEIAQSECANNKPFVNYWIHNEFVNIADTKISKSLGNSITLQTIKEKGFNPIAYRLLLLGARYSSKVNFTWEALEANQNALTKLYNLVESLPAPSEADTNYVEKLVAAMSDDLDTPKVVALVWEIAKDESLDPAIKHATLLAADDILGLGLHDMKIVEIPAEVTKLVDERAEARNNKDWSASDTLRDQIRELGFDVLDTPEGQKIKNL